VCIFLRILFLSLQKGKADFAGFAHMHHNLLVEAESMAPVVYLWCPMQLWGVDFWVA
jgi:hypothetical protein